MDGGASASYDELLKALNKALANADPQQASVVLSHLLEKKTLSLAERNKFGIMKCKILFGYFHIYSDSDPIKTAKPKQPPYSRKEPTII